MKISERSLVLYKTQAAVVTGLSGDKIDIETPGGSKKVREKDVELLHIGPVKNLDSVLRSKVPEADLTEAFLFFQGESPALQDIIELVWGACPAEQWWPIWQYLSASFEFVCKSPESPVSTRTPDEVQTLKNRSRAKEMEETERAAFLARLKEVQNGKRETLDADDFRYLQEVEAFALGKTDKSKILKDSGIAEDQASAHDILLKTGYWKTHFNPWPARHGCSLKSASVPVSAPDDSKERLDLTALDSWAIDNEWSSDPDDAVSIEGDILWVHVADPAATVVPDSSADKEARSRGSTLYVPEGASRMLHEDSLGFYALGLTETSRALSFRIRFTETGAIDEASIHRTLVKVTRLTYRQATERKDESGLAPLFAIARRNIERRNAAGAVQIDLPEVHYSVKMPDEGEPIVSIEPVAEEEAADMVREMMLLAGEAAARFAFKNKIPFQYVSQEAPEIPKDLPEGLAGEYRKRRGMRSRKVGTIPADHAGLGLGMYSQVTSPLRRYGDLVSHQQLHLFLDKKPLMDTDDMLTRIAAGDSAARECTLAERESNMHWTLVRLSQNPQWTGTAVVVEKNGPQAVIMIPELAREARINLRDDAPLNSTLAVRAGNIHLSSQSVTFIPVED